MRSETAFYSYLFSEYNVVTEYSRYILKRIENINERKSNYIILRKLQKKFNGNDILNIDISELIKIVNSNIYETKEYYFNNNLFSKLIKKNSSEIIYLIFDYDCLNKMIEKININKNCLSENNKINENIFFRFINNTIPKT